MLGKLIKHEFKATYWEFGLMFLAVLGIAGIEKIFMLLNSENRIIEILSGLFMVMYVICIVGCYIGSLVLIVKRFYVNLVKDQGYLSFTLPVTVSQHIISKTIVAAVWTIATYIVMILAIGIIFIGEGVIEDIPQIIKEIVDIINMYGIWWAVIEMGAIIIISVFSSVLQYYACISIGQMMGKHKVIGSIAAYFANGMIVQVIITVVMVIIELTGMWTIEEINEMSDFEALTTVGPAYLHFYLALMVVLTIIYFFISKIALEKKLNLE